MKQRKILIIHEIRMIRLLLKRYILSELNDATTFEAESGEEALAIINKQGIDTILCSLDLPDMNGKDVLEKRKQSDLNRNTPFIMIFPDNAEVDPQKLSSEGIEHYLNPPFNAKALSTKIDSVCNPKQWRSEERLHLPGTKAIINLANSSIETSVTNISTAGILCDLRYSEKMVDVLKSAYITIRFSEKYGGVEIKNILCKMLRMNVLTWNEDFTPIQLHAVWCFTGLTEIQKLQLTGVLANGWKEIEQLVE